jgi:dGTPase
MTICDETQLEELEFSAPSFTKPDPTGSSNDVRNPYQVDLGRIIHSSGFRRLQAKTQVMGTGEGDFHRTRLTHSLEVGQIARGIFWRLAADNSSNKEIEKWLRSSELIEAISFAHDIGHPPFGHAGEKALHKEMETYGGFEGNAQNIRLLTCLEKSFWDDQKNLSLGIKPSRRLIIGILKYPISYSTHQKRKEAKKKVKNKFFYDDDLTLITDALQIFSDTDREKFLQDKEGDITNYKSIDCSIMELADDIAYGVHDLEDGIGRGIIKREDIETQIKDKMTSLGITSIRTIEPIKLVDLLFSNKSYERKTAIAKLVSYFINDSKIQKRDKFDSNFFDLYADITPEKKDFLNYLKKITRDNVINRPQTKILEKKGQKIICDLFRALNHDPHELIGEKTLAGLGVTSEEKDKKKLARAVCDFIAGMTDPYAEKYHRRLFEPGYGSSTDEL